MLAFRKRHLFGESLSDTLLLGLGLCFKIQNLELLLLRVPRSLQLLRLLNNLSGLLPRSLFLQLFKLGLLSLKLFLGQESHLVRLLLFGQSLGIIGVLEEVERQVGLGQGLLSLLGHLFAFLFLFLFDVLLQLGLQLLLGFIFKRFYLGLLSLFLLGLGRCLV